MQGYGASASRQENLQHAARLRAQAAEAREVAILFEKTDLRVRLLELRRRGNARPTSDSEFALAYGRAAECYVDRNQNGWMTNRAEEVAEAARAARRAIEFGRDDALSLTYGGLCLGYVVGQLDDCAAYIDRALALNSNLAIAWTARGWVKICLGKPDVGLEHVERAMRLSPLDPNLFRYQTFAALAHLCARRYEEAAARAESALRDQPNHSGALRVATVSYVLAGRPAEAQGIMARLRQCNPGLRLSNLRTVLPPFRRPEDHARMVEGLRRAGLPE